MELKIEQRHIDEGINDSITRNTVALAFRDMLIDGVEVDFEESVIVYGLDGDCVEYEPSNDYTNNFIIDMAFGYEIKPCTLQFEEVDRW